MNLFVLISVIASLFASLFPDSGKELSEIIISSPQRAVELTMTLLGTMAFWGGVMNVAEKSGLVKRIAKLFKPLLKRIFIGIDTNGEAFGAIVMNISANLMGLGNAATPLGIKAVTALAKEENTGSTATRNIITLVVINTASIQLLPTTVAALRQAYGSTDSMSILPSVLLTSAIALAMGLVSVFVAEGYSKTRGGVDRNK